MWLLRNSYARIPSIISIVILGSIVVCGMLDKDPRLFLIAVGLLFLICLPWYVAYRLLSNRNKKIFKREVDEGRESCQVILEKLRRNLGRFESMLEQIESTKLRRLLKDYILVNDAEVLWRLSEDDYKDIEEYVEDKVESMEKLVKTDGDLEEMRDSPERDPREIVKEDIEWWRGYLQEEVKELKEYVEYYYKKELFKLEGRDLRARQGLGTVFLYYVEYQMLEIKSILQELSRLMEIWDIGDIDFYRSILSRGIIEEIRKRNPPIIGSDVDEELKKRGWA